MAGANQTAIGSLVPIWAGSGGSGGGGGEPVVPVTYDLYVSPSLGNDGNSGSISSPLATLDRVDQLIPTVLTAATYNIHLRNETYPLPARGIWFRSRIFQAGSSVRVFADEAWDPTVYTNQLTAAAAAGTGAAVVVTAGLVANAHRGQSIRILTGAAAGQYRKINANTVTDINVDFPFNPAPAVGDSFQIFTTPTLISMPATANLIYLISDNLITLSLSSFGPGAGPGTGMDFREGLIFEGLSLNAPVFTCLGSGTFYFNGVTNNDFIYVRGQLNCGYDLVASAVGPRTGWGMSGGGAAAIEGGEIRGFVHVTSTNGIGVYDALSSANIAGGFIQRLANTLYGPAIMAGSTTTPLLIGTGSEAGPLIRLAPSAPVSSSNTPGPSIVLANATLAGVGTLLSVDFGALVLLESTVTGVGTGGSSVVVSGTGRVVCNGAPALGSAVANDWLVRGAAAFNRAALAAVNSAVLGTDGSVATRAV